VVSVLEWKSEILGSRLNSGNIHEKNCYSSMMLEIN
jgi:hypothetical protein